MIPRGIHNKNPCNIERSWQFEWYGEIRPGHPKWNEAALEERFCVFEEPVYGLRAAMKNLVTYNQRRNIKTLRQAINRWAPPHENNAEAYLNHVARHSDIKPDDEWDFTRREFMIPVLRAMVIMECGWPSEEDKRNGAHEYWYSNKTYEEAYEMAIKGRITSHTFNKLPEKEPEPEPREPSLWGRILNWLGIGG